MGKRFAEIGDQIPASLYTAVAEVLAYVYQLGQYVAGSGQARRSIAHRLAAMGVIVRDTPTGMEWEPA